MMKRMLKRKIHPELLDVKSQKSDGQNAAGAVELIGNGPKKATSESVSLLAMQGMTYSHTLDTTNDMLCYAPRLEKWGSRYLVLFNIHVLCVYIYI